MNVCSVCLRLNMRPLTLAADPPMYAESLTGAVDIRDEDDDQPGSVGDYMFTPMYTYVYDYRYRCPPAYSEVGSASHVVCLAHGRHFVCIY